MKVILNEDVKHLGELGDVKMVANGYARNYLFPRNLAVPYNEMTVAYFEGKKAEIEARKEQKRKDSASLKEKLEEILGDMHNLFGDTNAVHISIKDDEYVVDKIIEGETIADVLDYVQFAHKRMVRAIEIWVSKSVKSGAITLEEGKEFISHYRSGLYGYTYLEPFE